MQPIVGIIDYQMGNLRSVEKGIERIGGRAIVSDRATEFRGATHLILPGVGAFRDAISELRRRDLVPVIKDWVDSGKPFLGICLGLQLLFDVSYEGGCYEGLGLIRGEVVRFSFEEPVAVPNDLSSAAAATPTSMAATAAPVAITPDRFPSVAATIDRLKVPHMGWNRVHSSQSEDPMLAGLPPEPYFYFVHSYYAVPADPTDIWLTSHYGHPFCAAVRRANISATQFHPEKSQSNGLRLLANFLDSK
jgi:imidazole glycerol-phosphate synthase subunit HisH